MIALAWYCKEAGGDYHQETFQPVPADGPDLYIITTAKKRDSGEWLLDAARICVPPEKIHIESWNSIAKYGDITNSIVIFDENRISGSGAWSKNFIKIARNNNKWIMLSATPGDTLADYETLFVANGFFKNRSEMRREHYIYDRYAKYPKIKGYVNTGVLIKYRRQVLVDVNYRHDFDMRHEEVITEYNRELYKQIMKTRWDIYKEEPIEDAGGLCRVVRRLCNSDPSRVAAVENIIKDHPKAIIFYNHDYELELLRDMCLRNGYVWKEWNGHKHELIPEGDAWVYLCNYTGASEGWNAITTDTIIFYSQSYSYKMTKQAQGRISRLNSPYDTLYYFHLRSNSGIDVAIKQCLNSKKDFNERAFADAVR